MRTTSFLLAAAALTLAFSVSASAQDVPLHVSQPAPHYVSNTSAQPPTSSQSAQSGSRDNLVVMDPPPVSLGEVARIARAKKASDAKSVKIFNDDNMPRAPLSSGEKAPGLDCAEYVQRRKSDAAGFLGHLVRPLPSRVARLEAIAGGLRCRQGGSDQHQRG